ncbi:hypothetical protein GDO81_021162 [Engystomops pustulosus]|uniref:Uncharacterized protein n=1 Tax=Engystomops pustulosus TaxID=76066 RepID=A0AAV6ZFG7_ENGPU|nr:hypothetical protein GDO81_021162 [Engystomops pustulosus]
MNSFDVFDNIIISYGPISTVPTGVRKFPCMRHQVSLKFSFGVRHKITMRARILDIIVKRHMVFILVWVLCGESAFFTVKLF